MFKFLFKNLPTIINIGAQVMGFMFNGSESMQDKAAINKIQDSMNKAQNQITNINDDIKVIKAKIVRQNNEISTLRLIVYILGIVAVLSLILVFVALIRMH